jgi:plastocyanin
MVVGAASTPQPARPASDNSEDRIMHRVILAFAAFAALITPLVVQATLADDAPAAHVNIVEPHFQPPRAWAYDPAEVTVPLGSVITWTNTGSVAHTVTAGDAVSFDSGSLDPQLQFSFTAESVGAFTYHCSFHPWMTGTITVTQ